VKSSILFTFSFPLREASSMEAMSDSEVVCGGSSVTTKVDESSSAAIVPKVSNENVCFRPTTVFRSCDNCPIHRIVHYETANTADDPK
jgi:hypothetical protein